MTGADAGSVYVLRRRRRRRSTRAAPKKRLHFMLSQNDSLTIDFKEFILRVDENPSSARRC